mmetsp:Transcript_19745/g.75801  ORF Transcript_19745/g.75801 Transcript_19745/m.75801 type:complete len:221 (+) Transcript_19745:137-799(+)
MPSGASGRPCWPQPARRTGPRCRGCLSKWTRRTWPGRSSARRPGRPPPRASEPASGRSRSGWRRRRRGGGRRPSTCWLCSRCGTTSGECASSASLAARRSQRPCRTSSRARSEWWGPWPGQWPMPWAGPQLRSSPDRLVGAAHVRRRMCACCGVPLHGALCCAAVVARRLWRRGGSESDACRTERWFVHDGCIETIRPSSRDANTRSQTAPHFASEPVCR